MDDLTFHLNRLNLLTESIRYELTNIKDLLNKKHDYRFMLKKN